MVVIVLYLMAVAHGFLSPYHKLTRTQYINMPPQKIHVRYEGRFSRPFVYGLTVEKDLATMSRIFSEVPEERYPIRFWFKGDEWTLGPIRSDRHLFGVEEGRLTCRTSADDRIGAGGKRLGEAVLPRGDGEILIIGTDESAAAAAE